MPGSLINSVSFCFLCLGPVGCLLFCNVKACSPCCMRADSAVLSLLWCMKMSVSGGCTSRAGQAHHGRREGKLTTQGSKCRYKMAPPGRTKCKKNLLESRDRDSVLSTDLAPREFPFRAPLSPPGCFSSSHSRPLPRGSRIKHPCHPWQAPRRIGSQRVAHV
jgi:hypothetical protein